jgi:hypothetical protein
MAPYAAESCLLCSIEKNNFVLKLGPPPPRIRTLGRSLALTLTRSRSPRPPRPPSNGVCKRRHWGLCPRAPL